MLSKVSNQKNQQQQNLKYEVTTISELDTYGMIPNISFIPCSCKTKDTNSKTLIKQNNPEPKRKSH